jgi:competence protein ComEA
LPYRIRDGCVVTMGDMQPIVLSRRRVLLGGLLLLAALLVGARFVVRAGARTGSAAPPIMGSASAGDPSAPAGRATAATTTRLVVYVVGAVRRPGLYRLPQGSRVADAVARAGGTTRKADPAALNLAAPLADGEQVLVPARLPRAVAASQGVPLPGVPAGPIQLSSATGEQLDSLPGIGPATAQKILDYRAEHGAFRSVEELDDVPGIGPTRVEQLRGLVVP